MPRFLTDTEKRLVRSGRHYLRTMALPLLLRFVNGETAIARQWRTIRTEPIEDWKVDELRQELAGWLTAYRQRRLSFGMGVVVRVEYTYLGVREGWTWTRHAPGLHQYGSSEDVAEFFHWVFIECVRANLLIHVKACLHCGHYHDRRSRYCSRTCRDQHGREKLARDRARARKHARHFRAETLKHARRGAR